MLPRKRISLTGCSCHARATQPSGRRAWRGWDLAAGAFSLVVWALVPKCPACLAAYVALWTGLGISLAGAKYLRWSLMCVSAGLLLYVVLKRKRRALAAT